MTAVTEDGDLSLAEGSGGALIGEVGLTGGPTMSYRTDQVLTGGPLTPV